MAFPVAWKEGPVHFTGKALANCQFTISSRPPPLGFQLNTRIEMFCRTFWPSHHFHQPVVQVRGVCDAVLEHDVREVGAAGQFPGGVVDTALFQFLCLDGHAKAGTLGEGRDDGAAELDLEARTDAQSCR